MRSRRPRLLSSRAVTATVAVAAAAFWCAAFCLVSSQPVYAASPPPAPSGIDLLKKAALAETKVSYSGTVSSVLYGRDSASASAARIDHQAPSRWRVWFIAPPDAYGRLIVGNEQHTYQYEPKTGKVFHDDVIEMAPAVAAQSDLDRVLRNYVVEAEGGATVAGQTSRILALDSRYTGTLVERLWVDANNSLVLKRELYHADGSIAARTSFENIKFVNDFPNGLFDTTVPAGMSLVEGASYATSSTDIQSVVASLHFHFAEPHLLPDGFDLEKGSVDSSSGVQTVQFVYSDGLRTFSLFENPSGKLPHFENATPKEVRIGDIGGQSAFVGGNTMVTWNAGGLNFTLVGDLTAKEFAKIGASIKT